MFQIKMNGIKWIWLHNKYKKLAVSSRPIVLCFLDIETKLWGNVQQRTQTNFLSYKQLAEKTETSLGVVEFGNR